MYLYYMYCPLPYWDAGIPVLCQAAASPCAGGPPLPLAVWFCSCVLWLLPGQGQAHQREALGCTPSIRLGCVVSIITRSQKNMPFWGSLQCTCRGTGCRVGQGAPQKSLGFSVWNTAAFGSASTYLETEVCVGFGSSYPVSPGVLQEKVWNSANSVCYKTWKWRQVCPHTC